MGAFAAPAAIMTAQVICTIVACMFNAMQTKCSVQHIQFMCSASMYMCATNG